MDCGVHDVGNGADGVSRSGNWIGRWLGPLIGLWVSRFIGFIGLVGR